MGVLVIPCNPAFGIVWPGNMVPWHGSRAVNESVDKDLIRCLIDQLIS